MDDLNLHDALIFLAASAFVLPVARRFHVSPIVGFLIIGIILGPFGFSRIVEGDWAKLVSITDLEGVRAFGELGVVFLLFMIGLELSMERLGALKNLVVGLGLSQIVLTGVLIAGIAFLWGNSLDASIVLGACLALSSTAVVLQILSEQGRFGSELGQGSFAVLLAQDIAVVPIIIAVVTLGGRAEGSLLWSLVESLAIAVFCVVVILGVGRLIIRPLFRFAGSVDSPAPLMALTVFTIISLASGSHAAGLSAALGAFLAGLLLAETEFRHEIAISIDPFKGLLLGVFFIAIGMRINIVEVWTNPWILLSILGLFFIKAPLTALLARAFGFRWASAIEMGLLLGQGGEFAFVVVAMALSYALLPADTAQFMITVVAGTVLLTPMVAAVARRLANRVEDRAAQVVPALVNHVIIVGYGRTGRLLADLLDRQQIAHVALDLDAERVRAMRAIGAPVYFGDARRGGLLERMHIEDAAAVVVCPDDPAVTRQVTSAARQLAPHVPIVARARDTEHAEELIQAGINYVVPETLEAGLQMGHALLSQIGLPNIAARDLVESYRSEAFGKFKGPQAS